MSFYKGKIIPAKRKIDMSYWNSFDPDIVKMLEKDYKIKYVDLPDELKTSWRNNGDTIVFTINLNSITEALAFYNSIRFTDEIDCFQISESQFVFSLWWD